MTVNLRKNSTPEKVYNALLLHEWMSQEKLVEKSGVPKDSISGALTKLRRTGLVIGSDNAHQNSGGRRWKKFKLDNQMYPAQPDFRKISTKQGKVVKKPELPTVHTLDEIMDRILIDFTLLRDAVQANQEQCKASTKQLEVIKKALGT